MKKRILSTILALAMTAGSIVCMPSVAMADDGSAAAENTEINTTVSVPDGTEAMENVIQYIKSVGEETDYGRVVSFKTADYDIDLIYGKRFSSETEFVGFLYTDNSYYRSDATIEIDWIVGKGWSNMIYAFGNPEWTGEYDGYAYATIERLGFYNRQYLEWAFTFTDKNQGAMWFNPGYSDILNKDMFSAFSSWDYFCKEQIGIGMRDLGFTTYENTGAIFTADNGIKYEVIEDDEVAVISIPGYNKAVIPYAVTYRGVQYKVTEIGTKAAKGRKSLKKVIINADLYYIDRSAFAGCSNLKLIMLDNAGSMKKVARNAFNGIRKDAEFDIIRKNGNEEIETMLLRSTNRKNVKVTYG